MDRVDFRSDTVTWPTDSMRQAMSEARLGDDVLGEDPTVIRLESLAAELMGKEAALFVASGTMGNLVATLSHATRGDEAIVGHDAHSFSAEAGGMAALGGIVPRPLPTNQFGAMVLDDIEAAVRPDNPHYPRSRLILLENSYGARQGYPLPPDYFASVAAIARRHGLRVHLDGARIFNAAVALDVEPVQITRHVDTVTFCLSKGLCAPVGSVLCGPADFVAAARRVRKSLGGGMRQAGVLAAAGLVALREILPRLVEDHRHAARLAQGLATQSGVVVTPEHVRTNMVFFSLVPDLGYSAAELGAELRRRANIWLEVRGERSFRAVTHYWISRQDVDLLLESLAEILLPVARRATAAEAL